MRTWDDIREFYQMYADGQYSRDVDFGNGMLKLIVVLESDPELNKMTLGTMMNWLVLVKPENDLFRVHIQFLWDTPDSYEIFLQPEAINESPNVSVVGLDEIVAQTKALLRI